MSLIPSDTLAVMKAHVANHHHLALADVEWLFQEIDALTAERDRLRDLAAALEAELAALRGVEGDGEHYRIALRPDIKTDDPLSPKTLLDDIVVNDVPMFRAEQMDRNVWWVCCYLDNDTHDRIAWDVRAKSNPLRIEWTGYEYPDAATYEHERERP